MLEIEPAVKTLRRRPPVGHLTFANDFATMHATNATRIHDLQRSWFPNGQPDGRVHEILYEPATAAAVRERAGFTLISSDGGEGTTRLTVGALLGIVPNDPEATVANEQQHATIASKAVYFALAGGNGCNWPISAHGRAASQPSRIKPADKEKTAVHYPMYYQILNPDETVAQSNIALSGFGLGFAAIAAANITDIKPAVAHKNRTERLAREAKVTLAAGYQAEPFSVHIKERHSDHTSEFSWLDVTGVELMKTRRYGKVGKNPVNIDDTDWQPAIMAAGKNRFERTRSLAVSMARLGTGKHFLPLIDFRNVEMTVQLTCADRRPVPFHADGETGPDMQLRPGQRLVARLVNFPVRTVIIR